MKAQYTTAEISRILGAKSWQVRRAVDALGLQIPRAGLYRLIPSEMLELVEAELRRRGYLSAQEVAR
jgi:hypothetical protein